jgi:hypothetical protein
MLVQVLGLVTFLLAQKSNQKRAPKTTAPRVFGSQRTQAMGMLLGFLKCILGWGKGIGLTGSKLVARERLSRDYWVVLFLGEMRK